MVSGDCRPGMSEMIAVSGISISRLAGSVARRRDLGDVVLPFAEQERSVIRALNAPRVV